MPRHALDFEWFDGERCTDPLPHPHGGRSMSSVDAGSGSATPSTPVQPGEMRLEVVVLPVSDVDRARDFYVTLGWRLDADFPVEDGYRVVQVTPPGSGCSVIFGEGVSAGAPGSFQGLQLSVYD